MNENGLRVVLSSCLALSLLFGVTASAVGEEVSEMEPNDTVNQTKILSPGQFGKGIITYTQQGGLALAEADFWRVSVSTGGDLVFAFVDGSESVDSSNTSLELINFNFSTLEADQDDGPGLSAAIGVAVSSQSGILDLLVSGPVSPVMTTINPYRLYQATIKPTESAPEQEDNNTFATANNITARMMTGDVSGADVDFYKVFVRAGERLVVILDDNPDKGPTNTDTDLSILDTNGTTVLATGDNSGSGDDNAAGAIIALTTGVYFIRVAHGGEAGALDTNYRFVVLVDGATPADRDTDGVSDSADNCPDAANPGQADTDGDGVGDVCDGCPNEPTMTAPGLCGCGTPETDTDGDGTPDCTDGCPDDPAKTASGACGCGVADLDSNGNGVADCIDTGAPGGLTGATACGTCGAGAAMMMPAMVFGLISIRRRGRRWRRKSSPRTYDSRATDQWHRSQCDAEYVVFDPNSSATRHADSSIR